MAKKKFAQAVKIGCRCCGFEGPFKHWVKVPDRYYNFRVPLTVVSCPRCGMVFLNPQYTPQAYEEFYSDQYYGDFDEHVNANRKYLGEYYGSLKERVITRFLKTFPAGGRYLEAGVGSGVWLDFLREFDKNFDQRQIYALEPSGSCIENLKKRFPNVECQRKVIEANDFDDSFFDNALCSALVEHFNDPLFSLLHFNRMIKKGGHLLLSTPALDSTCTRVGVPGFFKYTHTFYFSEQSIRSILEKAGFEISWIEYRAGTEVRDSKTSPLYFICAKKVEDRRPELIEQYRTLTNLDAESRKVTEALYGLLAPEFRRFSLRYGVKRMTVGLLPQRLKSSIRAIFKN